MKSVFGKLRLLRQMCSRIRALQNFTLPADVIKFYCIEVVIDVAERSKYGYL